MRLSINAYRIGALVLACAGTAAARPVASYFTQLESFNIDKFQITAGSSSGAKATLSSMTKSVPIVSFKSSNGSVAGVPSSRTADMYGNVSLSVNGLAAGCATVTATYSGISRSDEIIVHPAVTTSAFEFTVPDTNVPWPASIKGTLVKSLSLNSTSPTRTGGTLTIDRAVWELSSSNPAVATVPATVTQIDKVTTFPITGKSDGCAQITAKLGSASITRTVKVVYIGG